MTINEVLRNEYKAISEDYHIYGVFLTGVHNWKIETPNSKIRTIAIAIPSMLDILYGEPISKILDFNFGKCFVIDIRTFTERCKMGDFQCIEALYSMYSYINPDYEECNSLLMDCRGYIARMNEQGMIKSFLYYIDVFEKHLTDPNFDSDGSFQEIGYNRPAFAQMITLTKMLDDYTKQKLFRDVLDKSDVRKFNTETFTKTAIVPAAQKYKILANNIAQNYLDSKTFTIDETATKWINLWTATVIKLSIKGEEV